MQLTKDQAVSLFAGLGYQGSEKWTKDRMQARISKLTTTIDEDTTIGDSDLDNLLDEVLGALNEGEEVELVAGAKKAKAKKEKVTEEEVTEEVVEEEAVEEEKPKPKAKKEKKERKVPAKDEFGTRVGTQASAINEAVKGLGKEFTAKDVAGALAEGFTPQRIKDHLRWLVKNGHATQSEDKKTYTRT